MEKDKSPKTASNTLTKYTMTHGGLLALSNLMEVEPVAGEPRRWPSAAMARCVSPDYRSTSQRFALFSIEDRLR